MSHLTLPDDPSNADASITPVQLAAHLAARMCHDFISPAGAIVSGLDLLDDPTAQDMREEAMNLIGASAKKLVALLAFDRVAFGGSSAAETFDTRELERLTRDVFAHGRSTLEWSSRAESLAKPAARTVMNLAQIGAGTLPIGGVAAITVETGDKLVISVRATGTRVRLRPEVLEGLNGAPLSDGLSGHWVQAYFLRKQIDAVGGSLEVTLGEGEATIRARLPL
ncbi:MAG TPA: histidine phosphotransferase family protein [Caulobacteraceae bacterium]|jgi:histidine phosphotransferase ChpT|nr:histidine phosphotransferase family protein [Caulobacteraceae bacterium]